MLFDVRKSLVLSTRQLENHEITFQAREARLQAILCASPDSFLLIQRNGLVLCVKSEEDLNFNSLDNALAAQKIEDYFPVGFAQQLLQECFQTELTPPKKIFQYERISNGAKQICELHIIAVDQVEIIAIERDITKCKRVEEKNAQFLTRLETQHIQLQALYGKYADAQETERKRLAAELHDHIGQNLTILCLNLDLIRTQLSDNKTIPEYVHASLDESTALIEQTTELVRDVLADLRPVVLEHYGFLTALKWYVAEMRRRTGLQVNLHSGSDFPRLPDLTELALFRIVQEVFTNTIKHAQASQMSVSLTVEATSVRMTLADNGRGFDIQHLQEATKRQSWGLLTMQERAAAIGGSFHIVSYPGQGTRITVETPR